MSSPHLSLRAYGLFTLFLFIVIAILHALGFFYSLYFYLWWYDIVMHILGGFAIAILSAYIFFLRPGRSVSDVRKIFLTIFFSILVVGILWEVGEIFVSRYYDFRMEIGGIDTLADMINDMIGAFAGAWLFLRHSRVRGDDKAAKAVEAKILI